MNRYLLTALTSAALLVPASSALAAPGDPDPAFDGDGMALIDFGGDDLGASVAIQPDGKIVLAGISAPSPFGTSDYVVRRLNPDGTPDGSFSDDGEVRVDFAAPGKTSNDRPTSVALAPDGSVVVAGVTDANSSTNSSDMALARLTPGGALDSTFDGDGRATVNYGSADIAQDVAVAGDGSVTVGGSALLGLDDDFAVARLTPQGQPDKTWSTDGLSSVHFNGAEEAHGIALTADGGVVAAGSFLDIGGTVDTAVARFRADGRLDETGFGNRGKLTTSYGDRDLGMDVAVQADGKIVLAVAVDMAPKSRTVVGRLTSGGGRDPEFGDNGVAAAPVTESASPFRLALTRSGYILVTGQIAIGTHPNDFMLMELTPGGRPDGEFGGGDGVANYDFGQSESALSVATAGDRAIVTGSARESDVPMVAVKIDEPSANPQPTPETQPQQPQQQPEGPPAPPAADTVAPVLSKLKLKTVRGTEKATFRLSEQASVKVTVQRKVKRGRRTRLVAARTLRLKGRAGTNAVKVKKLKAGSYRVTLKATDAAGNGSKALRKNFALKRTRR